jgi:ABC-type Fe3+/spermidine/putrescine transport system ATPase subunit
VGRRTSFILAVAAEPLPILHLDPLGRQSMTQSPDPTAVALRGVVKRFGEQTVLDGLSLAVPRGEFLAIVGPSGSGKTTAMRVIGGFETPDEGSVWISGEDVTGLPAERRDVNTVFQSYALFPHLSVLDNIAYGPRMRGVPRAERRRQAGELLELVRLSDVGDRKPNQLSGGMQQRVALARALANQPAVLLLDEPLGALDRKLREEMQRELRRIQSELGATFIYITHDQEEAFGMADRLAVMRDGRFAQIGDPATLYDEPVDAWVALFLGSANRIRATVGEGDALASDLGPLAAGHIAADLAAGDRALVIIRPEQTRFERPVAAGPNAIAARIVDVVALGPSLRLRAVTAGGVEFESIERRGDGRPDGAGLHAGDAITVTFHASAARAYRAGAEPLPIRPSS